MAGFKRFEDIRAWQEARILAKGIVAVASVGEFTRDIRLRRQICDAADSVMANIAEGFERHSDPEFIRFLRIAKGSGAEVRSHLYSASDRKYLSPQELEHLLAQEEVVARKIGKLIAYLLKSGSDQNNGDESESASSHDQV